MGTVPRASIERGRGLSPFFHDRHGFSGVDSILAKGFFFCFREKWDRPNRHEIYAFGSVPIFLTLYPQLKFFILITGGTCGVPPEAALKNLYTLRRYGKKFKFLKEVKFLSEFFRSPVICLM